MFEDTTYEKILKRMLDRIPESFDKREGSLLYDALAPSAAEMQILYISLDNVLREAFGDTADREFLVKRAAEYGIIPNKAQAAEWRGIFSPDEIEVETGERFSRGKMNFRVMEKLGDGGYRLICESVGAAGNDSAGAMIPINYIAGLERAQLTELLIPGTDEEDTEDFRSRYLAAVRKPSTSGNRYDYYNWAMECSGVGAAKIFPLSDGPGTVKVLIANEERKGAAPALINSVKEHIEELRPIGATVTVASASEKEIHVTAGVRLKNGLYLGSVQDALSRRLSEYLGRNAFEISYVSLAKVGSLLLDVEGVEDFSDLMLNGEAGNVLLQKEEIAIAGTISLEMM